MQNATEAGFLRRDLFYRLHVFPIEIPPLRERKEDIPLLVEYFIDRYARKAGKHITTVDKKTLRLLGSYPWPGNIRELQNVIERSVIVCEASCFSTVATVFPSSFLGRAYPYRWIGWLPLPHPPKLFVEGQDYGMYFFGYGDFISVAGDIGYSINRHLTINAGYQLGSRLVVVTNNGSTDRLGLRLTQRGPIVGMEVSF